jgi:uncharacterized alkaline shock family protein YloU
MSASPSTHETNFRCGGREYTGNDDVVVDMNFIVEYGEKVAVKFVPKEERL